MNPDRTALATIGDLQDLTVELKVELKAELKVDLKTELAAFEERLTRSVSAEIGRVANVIMEHTTAQIRAAGDHPRAIEDRLDAHIADATVHRRPARARRS